MNRLEKLQPEGQRKALGSLRPIVLPRPTVYNFLYKVSQWIGS